MVLAAAGVVVLEGIEVFLCALLNLVEQNQTPAKAVQIWCRSVSPFSFFIPDPQTVCVGSKMTLCSREANLPRVEEVLP